MLFLRRGDRDDNNCRDLNSTERRSFLGRMKLHDSFPSPGNRTVPVCGPNRATGLARRCTCGKQCPRWTSACTAIGSWTSACTAIGSWTPDECWSAPVRQKTCVFWRLRNGRIFSRGVLACTPHTVSDFMYGKKTPPCCFSYCRDLILYGKKTPPCCFSYCMGKKLHRRGDIIVET